ncbi:MAG: AsmA family protein [Candidatus Omnitrophota bacterium]
MKKKIILAIIILITLIGAGIVYLNNTVLPTKIKNLIVSSLQEKTGKKVSIGSLRLNIFKGLVLKDLAVYDDKGPIMKLKEGSCTFLIWPFFKKMVIIPGVKLKFPEIFLERKQDGTFSLQDLFSAASSSAQAAGFKVLVYKIVITGSEAHFKDNYFAPPFTTDIKNLDITLHLSLPASVKFNLKAEVPSSRPMKINVAGEFKIPEGKLAAKASIQDLSPKDFSVYYQHLGINVGEGLINALINLEFKEGIISAGLTAQNNNLEISKEKAAARLSSVINASFQYNLKSKQIETRGKITIIDSEATGVGDLGRISGINGEITFDNSGIFADKLSANIWGVPVNARISLAGFTNSLLSVNITSSFSLAALQGILKDKFRFSLPGDVYGKSNLSLTIQAKIPSVDHLDISGYLDILSGALRFGKAGPVVSDINGRIEFKQAQLKCPELNFKYLGIPYKASGTVTNFQYPRIQFTAYSKDFSLESSLVVGHKLIDLLKCKGRYLNSEFTFAGSINTESPPELNTDIKGELNINLEDVKEFYPKLKTLLKQADPKGLIQAQFGVSGNVNNIKTCAVTVSLSGSGVSAYGFKAEQLFLDYNQAGGVISIPLARLSLYGGTIEAAAKMNLNSTNVPYWVSLDMQGVKIEKLKLDTGVKDKDIAGTIKAQVKLSGFSDDLSRLSGAGNIFISEGKLWQLNLFQGLGSLLFARDFASIVFNEGSCSFSIADKYIFTDNLKLKSNITNLSGSVKIGFDNSIAASLDVEVLNEMVPLSGTFKDITTAIIDKAGRFGVIKIKGTLKEPKYKFQPAVVDIIKGLKDALFGQ